MQTDCWFYVHMSTEVNDHPANLRATSCQDPPAVVDFLDYNFHYKSVATWIPHDAGLTFIPYIIKNSSATGDWTSSVSCNMSSKQNAVNRVAMDHMLKCCLFIFIHLINLFISQVVSDVWVRQVAARDNIILKLTWYIRFCCWWQASQFQIYWH